MKKSKIQNLEKKKKRRRQDLENVVHTEKPMPIGKVTSYLKEYLMVNIGLAS